MLNLVFVLFDMKPNSEDCDKTSKNREFFKMKISIVTVCFNEEKNIEKTINSVLRQSDNSYEYIICDGKSSDKTVEIAKLYKQAFDERGVTYTIKSEKDGGIYFGMNNGIDLASGDYIIFMNAGDCFHGLDAVKNIVEALKGRDPLPDVIYGDCNFVQRGYYHRICGNHNDLEKGMSICHQSLLVSTDILKKEKFNTDYKVGADYDLVLKCYLQGKSFLYIDTIISDFYAGGISSVKIKYTVEESFKIRDNYSVNYNATQEMRQAAKSERFEKFKLKMPYFMWAVWCKLKKRPKALKLNNGVAKQV